MKLRRLIFDEQNIDHIARHDVEPQEVEEACGSRPLFRRGKYGRLAVYGRTEAGRLLLAVLAPKGRGDYYVITARPMTRQEAQHFRKTRPRRS